MTTIKETPARIPARTFCCYQIHERGGVTGFKIMKHDTPFISAQKEKLSRMKSEVVIVLKQSRTNHAINQAMGIQKIRIEEMHRFLGMRRQS